MKDITRSLMNQVEQDLKEFDLDILVRDGLWREGEANLICVKNKSVCDYCVESHVILPSTDKTKLRFYTNKNQTLIFVYGPEERNLYSTVTYVYREHDLVVFIDLHYILSHFDEYASHLLENIYDILTFNLRKNKKWNLKDYGVICMLKILQARLIIHNETKSYEMSRLLEDIKRDYNLRIFNM